MTNPSTSGEGPRIARLTTLADMNAATPRVAAPVTRDRGLVCGQDPDADVHGWGPVDALDYNLTGGGLASMRRHGETVKFGFVPGQVVELSAEDCTEIGLALIAVGRYIERGRS